MSILRNAFLGGLSALLLAACRPTFTPPTPEIAPSANEAAPTPLAEASPRVSPGEDVKTRFALATEIQADVWLESETAPEAIPVSEGDEFPLHGVLETGPASRARLDILPDGTVIRVGAETRLQLAELAPQEPSSRLQLWFGQIWVILNGGQLEVETDSGVASVRGSMLGVSFDNVQGTVRVTCLEGHCALANGQGQVQLTAGQASTIASPEEPPSPPGDILPEERQEWQDQVPEAAPLLPSLPPPSPATPPAGDISPQPLILKLYNGCADGQTPLQGIGVWSLTLTDAAGTNYSYTLSPGQTESISLPPGRYQAFTTFPDGSTDSVILDSAQTPLDIDLCTPPPGAAPPDGGTGGSTSSLPPVSTQPSTYTLINPCDETWHWVFSGPATIQVDVPPGDTVNGTLLPIGTYSAEDWFDSGPAHNTTDPFPPGGNLSVTAGCP